MEDYQNKQQIPSWWGAEQWTVSPTLRQSMMDIMRKRREVDKVNTEENKAKLRWFTEDFYGHNSADDAVNTRYKQVSNYNWIAYMIYDYSVSEWAKDVPASPRDIMDEYVSNHPEKKNTIRNAIMDVNLDLEKFWKDQWWILTEDEEKVNWLLWWVWNVLETYGSFIPMSTNSVRNFVTKEEERTRRASGDTSGADRAKDYWILENLAFAKYWKNTSELSNREIAKLQDMAKDPKIMQDYASSEAKWTITALAGLLDWFISLRFPKAKLWLSVAANTPWLNLVVDWLWELIWLAWYVIDAAPWLYQLKQSLWAEEYQDIMDMSVASALAMRAAKSKKVQKWTEDKLKKLAADNKFIWDALSIYKIYKDWIDNAKAWLRETAWEWSENAWKVLWKTLRWEYNQFEDIANNAADKIDSKIQGLQDSVDSQINNAKAWWQKVKDTVGAWAKRLNEDAIQPSIERNYWADWNKRGVRADTPEWLEAAKTWQSELATKMTVSKGNEPKQKQAISDTINRLSLSDDRATMSKVSDIDSLNNAIKTNIADRAIEWENKLLWKSRANITPEDVKKKFSWTLEKNSETGGTDYERDPMKRAINAIRKMRKYSEWDMTVNDAAYEEFYKNYMNWNATPRDFYDMARFLTKEFKLYRKNWGWEISDAVTKQMINDIRVSLKDIAKDTISEQFPEVADALSKLDKVYSDAEMTMELFDEVINDASKERGKKPRQTPTQKQIWNWYDKAKDFKNTVADMVTNKKSLTNDKMNNEINYYLAEHDRLFDAMWREWYDFEEILKKINDLPDIEWFLENKDIPETTKNVKLWEYKQSLADLLEWLWYEEKLALKMADEAIERYVQESLFPEWTVEWGKHIDRLGRDLNK